MTRAPAPQILIVAGGGRAVRDVWAAGDAASVPVLAASPMQDLAGADES